MRRNFKVLLVFAFAWIFVVVYFIHSEKQPKVSLIWISYYIYVIHSTDFFFFVKRILDFMNENVIIQSEKNRLTRYP